MKRHIHYDVVVGIVLMILSCSLFPMTLKFPDTAGLFPQFILIVLFALGIYTLVHGIRESRHEQLLIQNGEEINSVFNWNSDKLPLAGYLIVVAYILAIKPIGFFVSTTIFMVVYMLFLKMKKPSVLILVTVGVDIFIYVLFVLELKLNLPSGILI